MLQKRCPSRFKQQSIYSCAGREAPGEAASRAHCTDKKQLFEQQLKYCSRFLQKKVDWAQSWCEKLTGLLNGYKKSECIAETC